ncbi:nucleotidyltransferase domain-containing protein [Cereibacter sphaeroides]|uniref:nucleotidyltransferase domain-containing protein n=1 Tax=Cereibacter sphaeroides TaxID=1063 RepID=UPI001F42E153|nr:nucleotidyltransferase domain-containing protein [Cereibacter sphaeroides]MCE6959351.1 nucleotidyltransferase domain-containing protein [Cereibacter sphaeroides]MCE6972943.1 nucleotidyltransferase domain-containing protein [Cereibacter sphaeroides]
MPILIGTDPASRAIHRLLTEIERRHDMTILLAVEGGSRAHGFASPGSDFDVRFIYRQPIHRALALFPERDVIEIRPGVLPSPGFDVEFTGWSLEKTLKLGLVSNPQIAEFSRLPGERRPHAAYFAEPDFLADLQDLGRAAAPRAMAHYFRGIVKVNLKKYLEADQDPKGKRYLHTLQALMRARWLVTHHERGWEFPLHFYDLRREVQLPEDVERTVEDLLAWKSGLANSAEPRRIPLLDAWIAEEMQALDRDVMTIPDGFVEPGLVEAIWRRCWPEVFGRVSEPEENADMTGGP